MPKTVYRVGLGQRLRNSSKMVLIGLNLLIYFFLLRWAGENIHPGRLMDAFIQIPGWALLCSFCINLLVLALCGVRMALLLGRDFRTTFSIVNIGYALNTLLPLRLGEPIRLYLSHRLFRIPLTGIFAASVAEKLFDLVMVLSLATAILTFVAAELIQVGTLLSVSILTLMCVGAVALFCRHVVRVVKLFPRGSRLRRISIELHKHASGYRIERILITTTGIWALQIFLVFFSFNTYLPEVHISIFEAVALLVVMALAIAIPSAPGGLGLFEAGIVAYLTQKTHVSNEAALVAASIFHIVIIIPSLAVTARVLWNCRTRLKANADVHGIE